MKFLLDTDTCIAYLRKRDSQVARRLASVAAGDVTLCSIVKAELFYGVQRASRPEIEEVRLRAFLTGFSSLPFDDTVAEVYGKLRAQLASQGMPVGPNDLMIGAIAVANNPTLVTHNTREFSRIDGLQLDDWEAPLA